MIGCNEVNALKEIDPYITTIHAKN